MLTKQHHFDFLLTKLIHRSEFAANMNQMLSLWGRPKDISENSNPGLIKLVIGMQIRVGVLFNVDYGGLYIDTEDYQKFVQCAEVIMEVREFYG